MRHGNAVCVSVREAAGVRPAPGPSPDTTPAVTTTTGRDGRRHAHSRGPPGRADQTWVRSSTTFTILAMASSNGMPFSCEPSR